MKTKLKECPFCGCKKAITRWDFGTYVVCEKCGANGPWKSQQTETQAIWHWNRRTK